MSSVMSYNSVESSPVSAYCFLKVDEKAATLDFFFFFRDPRAVNAPVSQLQQSH